MGPHMLSRPYFADQVRESGFAAVLGFGYGCVITTPEILYKGGWEGGDQTIAYKPRYGGAAAFCFYWGCGLVQIRVGILQK